jgi:hypothetical protein
MTLLVRAMLKISSDNFPTYGLHVIMLYKSIYTSVKREYRFMFCYRFHDYFTINYYVVFFLEIQVNECNEDMF